MSAVMSCLSVLFLEHFYSAGLVNVFSIMLLLSCRVCFAIYSYLYIFTIDQLLMHYRICLVMFTLMFTLLQCNTFIFWCNTLMWMSYVSHSLEQVISQETSCRYSAVNTYLPVGFLICCFLLQI